MPGNFQKQKRIGQVRQVRWQRRTLIDLSLQEICYREDHIIIVPVQIAIHNRKFFEFFSSRYFLMAGLDEKMCIKSSPGGRGKKQVFRISCREV